MNSEADERPEAGREPGDESPPAPGPPERPTKPAGEQEDETARHEDDTISLLDLMAEERAAREERPLPRPAPPVTPAGDEATPTGMPIPTNLSATRTPPGSSRG